MRNATVWIGLLGEPATQARLWEHVERERGELQAALGSQMATKFVPHLHLRRDTGGEYAAEIDRLLRKL
jgi:ribosome-binding factor A